MQLINMLYSNYVHLVLSVFNFLGGKDEGKIRL